MAKQEYSKHQQDIIKNYYQNLDSIMLSKLSELVTELYLAEGPKKDKLWLRVQKAMENLGVPIGIIEHIMKKRDVVILAKNLNDWMAVGKKK